MFGKYDAGWTRVFHFVAALSMLLTVCGPALQPSRVMAADPDTATATASVGAPFRPSLIFHTTLPEWLTGRPTQEEAPIVEPPPPAPELPHRPPVWLEVEVSPAAAAPGDTVTLTVRIKVEADLADAVLTSILPSGLDFLSAQSDRAVYNPTDRTLQWPLGQLLASDTPEFQFRIRMDATAPDLMVQNVEVRIPGYSGPAVGEVVLKRLFPSAEAIVTPDAGGELRSADGRVQVVFPPGAVAESLRVVHTPKRVDRIPLQAGGLGIEFDLDVFTADAAATPIHQFDKPLELRVDMAGLVDLSGLAYWQYPYLAWYDEAKGQWVTLMTRREGNTLVASLDHFTTLGGGTGNNYESGWLLAFNDAHVSTFTGGLNYDFPIQVPGGRGGLTPDLRLNYNSRRVDGILTWIQTDWAGLGWTLDTMSIARRVTPDYTPTGGKPAWYWDAWVGWENKFTLMYKGTGHKLKAGGSSAYGRYYTEDEQFLYIERRNTAGGNGSPDNETSEYWIVRLRDGTEYRLGYLTQSEQAVSTNYYTVPITPTESTYAGDTNGRVAFQWRVDKIADVHGNIIEFSYAEETATEGGNHDRASYLSQVRYNYLISGWGTRITFNRAARSSDGVGDTVDPSYQYYYFYQNDYLRSIKVENWDNGQYNTVREYLLAYDARTVPPGEHNNHTRRLASIKEYGTDGYGGDSLPATTFGYTGYWNKGICQPVWGGQCTDGINDSWDQEAFLYERLTSVNNGYGGTISLTYETPDDGWWQAWNYRVSQKIVSDGQSGGSKIAYAYTTDITKRCYVDPMNSEAFGCYFFAPMSTTGGSLVGYGFVTETLKTVGDTAIAVTRHDSKLDTLASPDRSKGREIALYHKDSSGNDLQKVETTWVVTTTPANTYFPYAQWVQEYTKVGTSLPPDPQKKTYYEYKKEQQGSAQYGNLTGVVEYQGANAYRQTLHYFYPNTTTWIVDRPGVTWLKDGAGTTQTKTKFIYDDLGNSYSTPPVRGDLVKKEQTVSVSPSDSWITTQTITYKDSTYYYLPYIVADGNGNQTTTTYDTTWKMYPLTVTNALSQATTYEYNYVLGKVKKVTGPNGSTTATSYEFDEFGRLTKVIRPSDSPTYPTIEYAYYDTNSPLRIIEKDRIVSSGVDVAMIRFYNGIGQLIQENKAATDRSQMTIANTTYNAQGLVEKSYVPYFATYSTAYQTPDTNQSKMTYAYDALGRLTTVTNPDSTTVRTFYDGLTKTVVDENSHQKIYENDALGRLATVKEYTGVYPSASLYATTTYAYSTLDLLATVTDAASNQTTMTYDALGRKTAMTDPDMGAWYYGYDAAGNLKHQIDAIVDASGKRRAICFYYDPLNRLKGKTYQGNISTPATYACPADPGTYTIAYTYDAYDGSTQFGKGYRTGMTDTSGSAAWKYDTRGRVTEESKVINGTGGGTFKTQWTYNSANMVVDMKYPGGNGGQVGETVTTAYDKWGQPSTLNGTNPYVVGTDYNALGQVELLKLGNTAASPTLQTDYIYFGASGNFRLQWIKTGPTTPFEGLQKMEYTYDSVGNVLTIKDYNAGGTQTQTFTYDPLDRILTAIASGGIGGTYSEPYEYTGNPGKIGNLTKKGTNSYTYGAQSASCPDGALSKPHTVVTAGSNTYCYDRNGNMVKRNSGSFTLAYDSENRLTTVSGAASATFVYDGDSNRVKATVNGITTTHVGNWYEQTLLYLDDFADGLAQGWTSYAGSWGVSSGTYRQTNTTHTNTIASYAHSQNNQSLIYRWSVNYTSGTQAGMYIYASNPNTTERTNAYRIWQDATTVKIYESINNTAYQRASFTASNATGQTHTYQAAYDPVSGKLEVWRDGTYLGSWTDTSPLTSGAYLSLRTTSTDAKFDDITVERQVKYYYHRGRRVVLRENTTPYYFLLTDHLTSTALTVRSTGLVTTELRYKAWGENRYSYGTTPTTYRFTGQREEATIGLYFYSARWYDPALGRFTQADALVPSPGNPQSLNRYSYVYSNPCRYVDPSGNCLPEECPGTAANPELYDGYPLSPQQIAFLRLWARKFGLPFEFLAAVLWTQQKYDYDWRDAVEDFLVKGALFQNEFHSGRTPLIPAPPMPPDTGPALILTAASAFDLSLGPAQVRISRASKMEQEFVPRGLLPPSASTWEVIAKLETDRGNIGYMAAYLRDLTDVRTGHEGPHLTDLTTVDMQIIYGAYRAGIPQGYGSREAYRSASKAGSLGTLLSHDALRVFQR